MLFTFVLCQLITHCEYSEIRTRLYTLKRSKICTFVASGAEHHFPIKFPFPYSPMMFPPHTCYLAVVRVVKNKNIREMFSCLAIFLSVTMVVRLSRNYGTQILNFVSCSDWFSRNYHLPETRQKNPVLPSGNKCHTGLQAGYHWTLLVTTNHVNVYISIKKFSLR